MPPLSDRFLTLIAVLGLTAAALGGIAAYFASPFVDYAARVEQFAPSGADRLSRATKADRPAPLSDTNAAAVSDVDASTVATTSPAGAALIVASPLPPSKPKRLLAGSSGLLNDAQINGIKNRLGLTPAQAEHWPAVEVALRDVARRHLGRGKKGVTPKIDVSSPEVQRLIEVAAPLVRQLREDQKREVRQLVRMIGLETVASRI